MRWLPLLLLWATPVWAWGGVLPGNGTAAPSQSTTQYAPLMGVGSFNDTETNRVTLTGADIVARVTILVSAPPGTGNTWTLNLRVGLADSTAQCVISGASETTCTTPWLAIDNAARISLECTPASTPDAATMSWYTEWVSEVAGETPWGSGTGATPLAVNGTNYFSLYGNSGYTATEADSMFVAPTAGVLSQFACRVSVAPGNGGGTQSHIFTVMQNSLATAMVITISEASVTGTDPDTVTVVAGETYSIRHTVTASDPASGAIGWCSVTFSPTVSDEFVLATSHNTDTLNPAATEYTRIMSANAGIDATESTHAQYGVPLVVKNIRTLLQTAPANGADVQSYTFTFRDDGADTPPRMTVSEAETTATASALWPTELGSILNWKIVPAGTPAASVHTLSMTCTLGAARIQGATLQGAAIK